MQKGVYSALVIIFLSIFVCGNISTTDILSNNGDCGPLKGCCNNYFMVNEICSACAPGTYGRNCSKECPDGFYGLLCEERCVCDKDCDKVHGCDKSESNHHNKRLNYWAFSLIPGFAFLFCVLWWIRKQSIPRNVVGNFNTVNSDAVSDHGYRETLVDLQSLVTRPCDEERVTRAYNTLHSQRHAQEPIINTPTITCLKTPSSVNYSMQSLNQSLLERRTNFSSECNVKNMMETQTGNIGKIESTYSVDIENGLQGANSRQKLTPDHSCIEYDLASNVSRSPFLKELSL